jgi:hypothetical protein
MSELQITVRRLPGDRYEASCSYFGERIERTGTSLFDAIEELSVSLLHVGAFLDPPEST